VVNRDFVVNIAVAVCYLVLGFAAFAVLVGFSELKLLYFAVAFILSVVGDLYVSLGRKLEGVVIYVISAVVAVRVIVWSSSASCIDYLVVCG
jgi:uncharacterized membrane protein SirB2